jgi:hypothetical protein
MQAIQEDEQEVELCRPALLEVCNRPRVRKHTVYINGKERVAFLERVAQTKLAQVKEPELIFLIRKNPEEDEDYS